MHVTHEGPYETDRRLRCVAAAMTVKVLDGAWWYEEFGLDELRARWRSDAIAVVRDDERWSQLVPLRPGDRASEPLRVWSCHFPPGMDNSGFVGWLAARVKEKTGSGVIVVCGQNSDRGGIHDYWGCPAAVANQVLAEVRALAGGRPEGVSAPLALLDGRRMRAVAKANGGEVGGDTVFTFTQEGDAVWARYAGGAVRIGYLVGRLAAARLVFRYAQVNRMGEVHGGHSTCEVATTSDGRIRILEHFRWESRPGSGTNVLEEVSA